MRMNNCYFDDPDFEEGYAGGIDSAAKAIMAMSDDELAELFSEIEDEPTDPFFLFAAECFIKN